MVRVVNNLARELINLARKVNNPGKNQEFRNPLPRVVGFNNTL